MRPVGKEGMEGEGDGGFGVWGEPWKVRVRMRMRDVYIDAHGDDGDPNVEYGLDGGAEVELRKEDYMSMHSRVYCVGT